MMTAASDAYVVENRRHAVLCQLYVQHLQVLLKPMLQAKADVKNGNKKRTIIE